MLMAGFSINKDAPLYIQLIQIYCVEVMYCRAQPAPPELSLSTGGHGNAAEKDGRWCDGPLASDLPFVWLLRTGEWLIRRDGEHLSWWECLSIQSLSPL